MDAGEGESLDQSNEHRFAYVTQIADHRRGPAPLRLGLVPAGFAGAPYQYRA